MTRTSRRILFRAAYPELSGQGLVIIVRGRALGGVQAGAGAAPFALAFSSRQDLTRNEPVTPVLTTGFAFENDRTLSRLLVNSEYVDVQKEGGRETVG